MVRCNIHLDNGLLWRCPTGGYMHTAQEEGLVCGLGSPPASSPSARLCCTHRQLHTQVCCEGKPARVFSSPVNDLYQRPVPIQYRRGSVQKLCAESSGRGSSVLGKERPLPGCSSEWT
ncbi:hypothetical protein ACOMHN_061916 [Nucella lapillus]